MRPGIKSLALSCVVFPSSLYLATQLPFDGFYEPLSAVLLVSAAVVWYRYWGVRKGLPEPYGRGRVTVIDAARAARSGWLIVLGGIVLIVGVMGSVFILPPVVFFSLVFGLMGGLPLSEVLFFLVVSRMERIGRGRIYSFAEEGEEDGVTVLRKTVELVPAT